MVKPHLVNRRIGAVLIFFSLMLFWPLMGAASSEHISDSDLDNAEFVEFSSHIMSIDFGKDLLVVAENVVLIADRLIGSEQFTTRITNPEDEVITIDSLYKGQEVLVQGFKLDDGRVVATRVQVQQP